MLKKLLKINLKQKIKLKLNPYFQDLKKKFNSKKDKRSISSIKKILYLSEPIKDHYNFRLGEIESAIGIEQLKKLPRIVKRRQEIAKKITNGIKDLKGIRTPIVKKNSTHAYYIYPILLDIKKIKIKREKIVNALQKEGLEGFSNGYVNLHLLPMFQKKIAYGKKGFPWKSNFYNKSISYSKGTCPVAEKLNEKSFIGYQMCMFELSDNEIDIFIKTFKKVWNNLNEIR